MDKVAVIGYMHELDKELRKRLSYYPFSQIIIEEAMNEALSIISKISDSSFTDRETVIGAIDMSIKSIFRRRDFPSEHKYWDSNKNYIGKKEYNKEGLDYNAFESYTSVDNQKSAYFIGGAKFCMEHYESFPYIEKNNKVFSMPYILKITAVIIGLTIAYLFVLNDRYYISKNIIIDKWEQKISSWGDLNKD